mgnify:CR=1 FL=1
MTSLLRIADARVVRDRCVELTLTDGRTMCVDLTPLLVGPLFEEIRQDDGRFAELFVDSEFGALAWPNGADICPDLLIQGLPNASRPV